MGKEKLTVAKRILLVLAFLADCLDEARLLGGLVGLTFKQTYGWVPPQYKRKNLYSQVKRLIDSGYVKKAGKGKSSVLALTSEGRIEALSLSGVLWPERWDGLWTIVCFDIKETSRNMRDKLRSFLRKLKFGMFQRSVWIFPGDFVVKLRQSMKETGLQNFVLIISSKDLGIKDCKALVERVWRVSALSRKYKRLLEEIGEVSNLSIGEQGAKIEKLKESLLILLNGDPMLPLALLPDGWVGKKVVKLVSELERKRRGKGK